MAQNPESGYIRKLSFFLRAKKSWQENARDWTTIYPSLQWKLLSKQDWQLLNNLCLFLQLHTFWIVKRWWLKLVSKKNAIWAFYTSQGRTTCPQILMHSSERDAYPPQCTLNIQGIIILTHLKKEKGTIILHIINKVLIIIWCMKDYIFARNGKALDISWMPSPHLVHALEQWKPVWGESKTNDGGILPLLIR